MSGLLSLTRNRIKKYLNDIYRLPSGTVSLNDFLAINSVSRGGKPLKATVQQVVDLSGLTASDITDLTDEAIVATDNILYENGAGGLRRDTVQGIVDLFLPAAAIGTDVFASPGVGVGSIAHGGSTASTNLALFACGFANAAGTLTASYTVFGASPSSGTYRNIGAPTVAGDGTNRAVSMFRRIA